MEEIGPRMFRSCMQIEDERKRHLINNADSVKRRLTLWTVSGRGIHPRKYQQADKQILNIIRTNEDWKIIDYSQDLSHNFLMDWDADCKIIHNLQGLSHNFLLEYCNKALMKKIVATISAIHITFPVMSKNLLTSFKCQHQIFNCHSSLYNLAVCQMGHWMEIYNLDVLHLLPLSAILPSCQFCLAAQSIEHGSRELNQDHPWDGLLSVF